MVNESEFPGQSAKPLHAFVNGEAIAGYAESTGGSLRPRTLGRRALASSLPDGFIAMERPYSAFEQTRTILKDQIIGQDAAIDAIIDALDRQRARLPEEERPVATFAFLGPTGVGKSQTAKVLAESLTGLQERVVKVDCSNFSHGHEISKLVGSPPSYVGSEQEPFFSSRRIEQPGTVVLFDEIEKGSGALYNLMLQILGDGRLQLNNGEVTSFSETIIILTSNLGANELSETPGSVPLGFGSTQVAGMSLEQSDKQAMKRFTEFFSPEFVNRIDKQIVFRSLDEMSLGKVLDVKTDEASGYYEDEYGIRVSLTPATRQHLVDIAIREPQYGARPLVRAFEENVQSSFGRYLSARTIEEGSHVRIFHRDELPEGHAYRAVEDQLIFGVQKDDTIIRKVKPSPVFLPPIDPPEDPGNGDEN